MTGDSLRYLSFQGFFYLLLRSFFHVLVTFCVAGLFLLVHLRSSSSFLVAKNCLSSPFHFTYLGPNYYIASHFDHKHHIHTKLAILKKKIQIQVFSAELKIDLRPAA
jgi:hypothetical protein